MRRWGKLEERAKATFWGYLGCELVSVGERETIVRLQAGAPFEHDGNRQRRGAGLAFG
ncbi:hypothetical protein M5W83_12740 [Paenibacillus thiaminolyticus]|uniref:Uncharacterized protein n=1 Tax=Paenibacillus thiaminolyticus TaxID=49283 RepID=A0ABT4FV17_PANTH|nr:hypothetical protein [Paenibacillus thiaminolyticus]MCY9537062.1 hypothetical protein [Paenibacillus thiaminolyticus]MCY9603179.1 hypothetical protein [Paenibacillus thiaminolyticus]MCY9608009.1 hypothetical protein [Paenibacillus thiaminolyticus]MCY9613626.1 hypothetical protein [Paenibacillus thiaminolyticus]MCY9618788.1 hypothetical protein [Paenibacillus thiaminolyticus]